MNNLGKVVVVSTVIVCGGYSAMWFSNAHEIKSSLERHKGQENVKQGVKSVYDYTSASVTGFPLAYKVAIDDFSFKIATPAPEGGESKQEHELPGTIRINSNALLNDIKVALPGQINSSYSSVDNESLDIVYKSDSKIHLKTDALNAVSLALGKNISFAKMKKYFEFSYEDSGMNIFSADNMEEPISFTEKSYYNLSASRAKSEVVLEGVVKNYNTNGFFEKLLSLSEGSDAEDVFASFEGLGLSNLDIKISYKPEFIDENSMEDFFKQYRNSPDSTEKPKYSDFVKSGDIDIERFHYSNERFGYDVSGNVKHMKGVAYPDADVHISFNNFSDMTSYMMNLINTVAKTQAGSIPEGSPAAIGDGVKEEDVAKVNMLIDQLAKKEGNKRIFNILSSSSKGAVKINEYDMGQVMMMAMIAFAPVKQPGGAPSLEGSALPSDITIDSEASSALEPVAPEAAVN